MGDLGSSLPETAAQEKTQWVAGTSVVVAWGDPAYTAFRSLCGFSCQCTYHSLYANCIHCVLLTVVSVFVACVALQLVSHVAHSAAAVGSLYNHGGGCKFLSVPPWH